jgi:prepilin-type processing-associated H-X9-DG protein
MPFTCPKCGLDTFVAENDSATEKHCEHCGHSIGPLHGCADQTSANIEQHCFRPPKMGLTLLELLFILLIIGVLVALLLPVTLTPRSHPKRDQCTNNQKQITLALLMYEDEKGHFPPAFIPDKNGKPMHSWRVLILPYLERQDLYEQYDFNEPWDGPHNCLLADKMPAIFRCPSNTVTPNCTGYALLVGPRAFSPGTTGRTLDEITRADGTSTTLMLVEAADAKINWLEPRDLNVDEMTFHINKSGKEISSHHAGVANVSYCDGHQSTVRDDIAPETLKALTTFDGGEPLEEGEF